MEQNLKTTDHQSLPQLSTISVDGMVKANRLLGDLTLVSKYSKLLDVADLNRIISTVNENMLPCTKEQSASLVAELFACYPEIMNTKRGEGEEQDFKAYQFKIRETFAAYPFFAGKAAVHGATGVPSKHPYKPKPHDLVAFMGPLIARRMVVRAMAKRQIAEHDRRELEAMEPVIDYSERAKRANEIVNAAGFNLPAID